MKKLIPAILMLLISAVLVSTASYAWFSMNTQVTATGMQIQAQSESGIVISNEDGAEWKASANAKYSSVASVVPTSTYDVSNWYHNRSDDASSAKADQPATNYTALTPTVTNGIGGVTSGSTTTNYYLLNKFYIKSSAEEITSTVLKINKVLATGASTSANLDASLRVAIKINNVVYFYAPVSGATLSYNVGGYTLTDPAVEDTAANRTFAHSVTAVASYGSGIVNTATTVTAIPANTATTANAIEAEVYIYFEGEDIQCMSNNITATLDTLHVEIVFGLGDL